MTLSHLSLHTAGPASQHRSERKARGVGVALGRCVRQALESGRLQCGILPSATMLQRCPERVLLCLLPVPQTSAECDHALHINHTLISAFCAEHGIRCLRVDSADLQRTVVSGRGACPTAEVKVAIDDGDTVPKVTTPSSLPPMPPSDDNGPDVSCVLVNSTNSI
ncbi:hypothetical protein ACOMHN_030611 [Nucella lapillus]